MNAGQTILRQAWAALECPRQKGIHTWNKGNWNRKKHGRPIP